MKQDKWSILKRLDEDKQHYTRGTLPIVAPGTHYFSINK